jgi:hypothetical protein
MARRKNAPESIRVKHGLSDRLRSLRTEFYGERGGPDLARTLGIPVRTWYNYENGVTVPAEIILRIVELTSIEPIWLLRGEGPKFRENGPNPGTANPARAAEGLATSPITTLLRVALERLEEKERTLVPHLGSPIITRRENESLSVLNGAIEDVEIGSGEPLEPGPGDLVQGEWSEGRRAYRSLRVLDDSMAPIVAQGALVAYAEPESVNDTFNEKLVVAWIDGSAVVRWFQYCGRFALLRAENPNALPPSILIELDLPSKPVLFHRVLWISTPH